MLEFALLGLVVIWRGFLWLGWRGVLVLALIFVIGFMLGTIEKTEHPGDKGEPPP